MLYFYGYSWLLPLNKRWDKRKEWKVGGWAADRRSRGRSLGEGQSNNTELLEPREKGIQNCFLRQSASLCQLLLWCFLLKGWHHLLTRHGWKFCLSNHIILISFLRKMKNLVGKNDLKKCFTGFNVTKDQRPRNLRNNPWKMEELYAKRKII